MVSSMDLGFFSRMSLTVTFFPTIVWATAFRKCAGESIGLPSYSTMTSPRSNPAFLAGLSSIMSLTNTPFTSFGTPNCEDSSGVSS
jgi:hypothetical protein